MFDPWTTPGLMETLSEWRMEMARSSRHPPEVRERAVALVVENQSDYASQWGAIVSIAVKVGASAETLLY